MNSSSPVRPIDELVAQALAISDWEDDDEYWSIVGDMQSRIDGTTFSRVVGLCHGATPPERRLGADVLGQYAARPDHPRLEHPHHDAVLPVLIDMAATNHDSQVVASVVGALARLHDPVGLAAVLGHRHHPAARVRQHVAMALPDLAGSPPGEVVVEALLELSDDPDEAVRDWATFGLGTQLDIDTPAVREALVTRIDDPDAVTSGEALVGLARRRDPRALPHVLERLRSLALADYLIDAAAELGDPRFLPLLQDLHDMVGVFNGRAASLEEAIEACGGRHVARRDDDHPVGFRVA